MAGYVITDLEITDAQSFAEYRRRVPETVTHYGGKYLVSGGKFETLEGNWNAKLVVVIEFPSFARAKEWYDSPEYQAILPLRERGSRARFFSIVEGV